MSSEESSDQEIQGLNRNLEMESSDSENEEVKKRNVKKTKAIRSRN